MELTDRQRRLAFAGLVVALAAAGIYLTLPGGTETGRPTASPAVESPGGGSGGDSAPTTAPTVAAPSPAPSAFDIYSLLPFGEKEFAGAADAARRFTAAYGTYRYDEEPKAYLGRLDALMAADLRSEIERGAASPGLIEQRKQEQAVATSEATVESIRDIEKSSITFLVTGKQQITRTGQSSENSQRYSVTVSKDAGGWKIYAFQPADIGQAGDTG